MIVLNLQRLISCFLFAHFSSVELYYNYITYCTCVYVCNNECFTLIHAYINILAFMGEIQQD